ncbi:tRNA pseudouridine synthase Pus10 [Juglans regia]|uniref:tRNA pseudouridine(55) synthase n=1 Tax=Juglans regia TaxID=51240 RepID=A0A6P9DSZ8_JUGRE|nr:tRNA pseudouridine synthase Pus10 [Juglans regia]
MEPEVVHNISATVEGQDISGYDDVRALHDVVQGLPSHVMKDLLSIGVCARCIFRLFGIRGNIYSCSLLSSSMLSSVLGEQRHADEDMVDIGSEEHKNPIRLPASEVSEVDAVLCTLCLGILQFTYCDDKELVVKKSAKDMAVAISELLRREWHQIDSFSLEVSIPPIVLENDSSVWLYMKRKYGSELCFQGKILSQRISTVEALILCLAKPLETLLDCKSGASDIRICLTFTHSKASKMVHSIAVSKHGFKRTKTGIENYIDSVDDSVVGDIECSDLADVTIQRSFGGSQDNGSSQSLKFPPEKVEACRLVFLCYRNPIFFGGRYLKYSRNVSQTRWIIDDERKGEASVEEIVGGNILPMCQGDNYKFHAAGREDIDVRMLGSGRPFLVEIQNARHIPSEAFVKEIETKINNLENKLVEVKNLKAVGSQGWDLMREGEAEKQKQYAALVWISCPLKDEDLDSIASFKDMKVLQRTPIRVLHRRSPLEREKIIHWMKIEKIAGSNHYFLLHLCTQAGTYIKEFVHGDLGRTHPSVGSLLGCRAEILQLDVTDVKMDCF